MGGIVTAAATARYYVAKVIEQNGGPRAVAALEPRQPAIPYYTFKGAKECFAYMVRELPWCGAIMYKRTWRGLVTAYEYRPNTTHQARVLPSPECAGSPLDSGR